MFELLYIGSIFCAFLTIFLLLFKENAIRSYADYILSTILLLEIYFVVIYLLIYSGVINQYPYLYKTAAPFNFLIPPLAFIYVRSVLSNTKGIPAIEVLHFFPFLLTFINYTPFFFIPIEDKREIVKMATEDMTFGFRYQAGILPEYIIFYSRIIQGLVYLILQWQMILGFRKENREQVIQNQITQVIKWVKTFTWIFTFILFGFVILSMLFYVIPISKYFEFVNISQSLILSGSFFSLSSYLLIHPRVLDGLPFIKYQITDSALSTKPESRPFIIENFQDDIKKIEDYLDQNPVYLNPTLTLTQISASTSIPIKDLSFIINSHFKMRFNDFINKYRINYFLEMIDNDQLNDFTMDALMQKAGFSSKNTFLSAFKKIHQCTPSQFITRKKDGK